MTMPTVPHCIGPLIDISGNNGLRIDLAKAKAGDIQAVFIKATEAATFQDKTFAVNLKKVLDQSLLAGSYHFGIGRPAGAQVRNFLEHVVRPRIRPGSRRRRGAPCRPNATGVISCPANGFGLVLQMPHEALDHLRARHLAAADAGRGRSMQGRTQWRLERASSMAAPRSARA